MMAGLRLQLRHCIPCRYSDVMIRVYEATVGDRISLLSLSTSVDSVLPNICVDINRDASQSVYATSSHIK
jgi:hypothetical protein